MDQALLDLMRSAVRAELEPLREQVQAISERRAEADVYLTTDEAAKVLRVHAETVRRMVASGKLPRRDVAGSLRFARADLDKLLGAGDAGETAKDIAERMVKSA